MKENSSVNRRGFLKGIAQSVSMVALAKFFKIVPEARALAGAKAGKGTTGAKERFSFVPVFGKASDEAISQIDKSQSYRNIVDNISSNSPIIASGTKAASRILDNEEDGAFIGYGVYSPAILKDGGKGAIFSSILENGDIHSVGIVYDYDIDITRKANNFDLGIRAWVPQPDGTVSVIHHKEQAQLPVSSDQFDSAMFGIAMCDNHCWCVHYCNAACGIMGGAICSILCVGTGPLVILCAMACAAVSLGYCSQCDWYCNQIGY